MLLSMYYIAPSSNTQLHRTLTRRSHGNIFTLADDLPIWDCVYSEGHSHAKKKKTAFHASNGWGWVPLLHYILLLSLVLCYCFLLLAAAVLGQISSLKPKDLKIAANVLLLLKMYLLFSWYEILFLLMGGHKFQLHTILELLNTLATKNNKRCIHYKMDYLQIESLLLWWECKSGY